MAASRQQLVVPALLMLGSLLTAHHGAAAPADTPSDWLDRMAAAVETTNCEGTVLRMRNGTFEALKVVHIVTDGVIRERVVVQEGNGLEIIRNGNEVQCILPDKQSVLVEEWNDKQALFSSLPSSDIRFGSEYDVSIVRTERVAGRKSVLLAIRPHDDYRFGYRVWLDEATGFPLQTKLLGDDGKAIEQVKFADIKFGEDIQLSALAASVSTENFTWFTAPKRAISRAVEIDWETGDLPPGFRPVETHAETLPDANELVTHILFSDGLASVSVFIEPSKAEKTSHRSRVGLSNSFSSYQNGYRITAVGEVPAATVERIAKSMQRK
jgi:sigma-E factor negative regulatory protein RseB